MTDDMTEFNDLPENVRNFIKLVVKKVRYRKKVRADVFEELVTHFVDELAEVEDAGQREQVAEEIIAGFGESAVLGKLIRRGKKRCRPLWKKVLIAGFKIGCVLVLLVGLRTSTFFIGKPVIKTNYAKWLTEKASAGKDPNLNAKIDIDRAIELLDYDSDEILYPEVIAMWPEDMNGVELQASQKYLADNADVIKAIRDAANKPYFWVDYESIQFGERLLSEVIAEVVFQKESDDYDIYEMGADWRRLARTMLLNVRFDLYNGQIDQAVNDCLAVHKMSSFFEGQRLLLDQLVGFAIESLSRETIFEIFNRVEITEAQLLNIAEHLKEIAKKDRCTIDLTGEKAMCLDLIQRVFTDNGKGDGRMLFNGFVFLDEDRRSFIKGFLLMNYPRKKEVIKEVERLYNQANRLINLRPLQQLKQQLKITSSSSFMLKLEADLLEGLHELNWRVQTRNLAFVTIVAIKRYELETGRLPDSLGQLVEFGYMDALPMDPFSDGSLGYKIIEDDFVLYSVGMDFEDDGGKVEYHDNGKVNQWKGSDYIFWPTRKKAE